MPILITYVGKRERYTDGLYGTGNWIRGETKAVEDGTARKMLRHPDQYLHDIEAKPADPQDTPPVIVGDKKPTEGDDENAMQAARDSVAHMPKDALLEYAKVHFKQSLDKRLGVEKVRAEVVRMIDQYGLT